jgi:signal transduction histidine kinase
VSDQDQGEPALAPQPLQHRLIEALLTLARSEGGVSRREAFELGAVIDNVLLSLDLDAGSLGLYIGTTIGPAPVSGNPRLVERLVRNLADNAIRHNQPRGRVDITAGTRSGHAMLAIINTGPPILPADIDRLFQPFQRLTPNRNNHPDGTGLGLSIVKAIADAHQASITADPQPHGGLRVEVIFPATERHDEPDTDEGARRAINSLSATSSQTTPVAASMPR